MTSENTPAPTPVRRPVPGELHHYQPRPGYWGMCLCAAPRYTPDHWHRYEPTLVDLSLCMCGGRADAEQHHPAEILRCDQELTEADVARLTEKWREAQQHNPPLLLSAPVSITGRDPDPAPVPPATAHPVLDWFLEVLRIRIPGRPVTCCPDLDCGTCAGCALADRIRTTLEGTPR